MEPERKIERWLRAYGKKRRGQAREPLALHPATRRLFHSEIARNAGRDAALRRPGHRSDAPSLWGLFRRRWALPMTFVFSVFVAAALLIHLVITSWQERASRSLGTLGMSQIPASSNSWKLTNGLAANEVLARAEKPKTESPRLAADNRTFSPMQPPPPAAERSYSTNTSSPTPPAIAINSVSPAPPAQPAPVGAVVPPASLARPEQSNSPVPAAGGTLLATVSGAPSPATNFATASRENSFYGAIVGGTLNQPTANSNIYSAGKSPGIAGFSPASLSDLDKIRASAGLPAVAGELPTVFVSATPSQAMAVLATFRVEQNGNAIRFVDQDGSVYEGSLLAANPNEAGKNVTARYFSPPAGAAPAAAESVNTESMALNHSSGYGGGGGVAAKLPASAPVTAPCFFRVSGLNRTLGQNVVFTGSLLATVTSKDLKQKPATRLVAAAFDEGVKGETNQAGQLPWAKLRIAGTAVIGQTNQIRIAATPAGQ